MNSINNLIYKKENIKYNLKFFRYFNEEHILFLKDLIESLNGLHKDQFQLLYSILINIYLREGNEFVKFEKLFLFKEYENPLLEILDINFKQDKNIIDKIKIQFQ